MKYEVLTGADAELARLCGTELEHMHYGETYELEWFPWSFDVECTKTDIYRIRPKPAEPAIDPGEGYRQLGPDEVIQEGDEYLDMGLGQWKLTQLTGHSRNKCLRFHYRRKLTPPAPKMRDLRPDDIMLGSQVRKKVWDDSSWSLITEVGPETACVGGAYAYAYSELREHWLIRYPGTSEFVPCEKEVEQ
jgi:hypothetical protein